MDLTMTFSEKVLKFYSELHIGYALPEGVEVMNPYRDSACFEVCKKFYNKFYNDDRWRFLILGINPGRFGAGRTGIPFTDPVKLETLFGIENAFLKKPELSADFIHRMIDAFGGHEKFFSKFLINSVSPLGLMKDGKNLNYYDTPALKKSLEPFIKKSIETILSFGIHQGIVFCLGEGANYKYLLTLNGREKWFKEIIPLAHPRFIMQYKRKKMQHYIDDYLQKFDSIQ
ncbi:MAG: uracil-DNA glycosylase family protein [Cyclobacteriaceae bacterium]